MATLWKKLARSIRRNRSVDLAPVSLYARAAAGKRSSCRLARPRLTRRGVAAVALAFWLLAVALMSQTSLALLAFCLYVAALLVAAVQSLLALRNISVQLNWPDHAEAGQRFTLTIAVWNGRRVLTAWNLAFEAELEPIRLAGSDVSRAEPPGRLEPRVPEPHLRIPLGNVPAGTERLSSIELCLPDRGLYRLHRPAVQTDYPLGVVRVSAWCPELEPIYVYPRVGRVRELSVQREQLGYVHEEAGSGRRSRSEGDFHGLRQFREGDSSRWIHWRTSARLAKLMVKEFERRHGPDAFIMFDAWLPAEASERELERFEEAVSFVASSLRRLAGSRELRLTLALAGWRSYALTGRVSPRLIRAGLETLSVLEGSSRPDWDELLLELPPRTKGTARMTLVTTDRSRHEQILEQVQARRPQWASAFEAAELVVAGSSRFYRLFQIELPRGQRRATA